MFKAQARHQAWLAALSAVALAGALMLGVDSAHADVDVEVDDFYFEPTGPTIGEGETVHWDWEAGTHSVTAVDGSFDSGVLSGAESQFDHTFAAAGTYFYYCVVHAEPGDATDAGIAAGAMVGKIIVSGKEPSPTATETASPTETVSPTETATATATGTATGTATQPAGTSTPLPPDTGVGGGSDGGDRVALVVSGLSAATVGVATATYLVSRRDGARRT